MCLEEGTLLDEDGELALPYARIMQLTSLMQNSCPERGSICHEDDLLYEYLLLPLIKSLLLAK